MVTALEGTTVIEVAGHVAAPYAGSLLGDLGCEVIKVELPDGGDTHRGRNPKYEGYGPSFRALNRNKKSVTINLQKEEGRKILLRLLDGADVLIENFRPPTRSRLGLDYEGLAQRNPGLIHCSISGYGQSGPYRDKPGFDTIAQALSGMLHLVTDREAPKVVGVSITDHSTGIFATYGIMAALLARYRTGRGQFVDASLLQVSLSFIESHLADYLNGGEPVSRDNFPRGRIYCFVAGDGQPLVIHLSGHQEAWGGAAQRRRADGPPGRSQVRHQAGPHRTPPRDRRYAGRVVPAATEGALAGGPGRSPRPQRPHQHGRRSLRRPSGQAPRFPEADRPP